MLCQPKSLLGWMLSPFPEGSVSLSTVQFRVTGELLKATSAELAGDQDLHGLQCMMGGGPQECTFGNVNPK